MILTWPNLKFSLGLFTPNVPELPDGWEYAVEDPHKGFIFMEEQYDWVVEE